jgi:O-acetyl-ADP-ribose deacetylase (regulator of RNase III)
MSAVDECIINNNHHPDVLINPANEHLVGTALNYFPRGGPCPPQPPTGLDRTVRGWCGMEAGAHMLYPAQTVDGIVQRVGGAALKAACQALPNYATDKEGSSVKCPVGKAVSTPACGGLGDYYRWQVVHTVAPYRTDATTWREQLLATYTSALELSFSKQFVALAAVGGTWSVAMPLIGSGARGGDIAEVSKVAAQAVSEFTLPAYAGGVLSSPRCLMFCVIDDAAASVLAAELGKLLTEE